MSKNKKLIWMIVGAVIIAGVFFYAGMSYGGNNVRAAISARGVNGGNFSGQRPAGMNTRGGNGAGFGGGVSGQILSQDDQSLVITMRDGGSRIVFLATSTPVTKSVPGSKADLKVGEQVMITGAPNSDGSLTAQSIQIRPAIN